MTIPALSEDFDNQKKLIMQISREMALVKSRDQLDSLISSFLKEIIGYKYATVFVLGDDGREITNFLKECGDTENRNQFSARILTGKIPFDHKINNLQVQSRQPIIDFDELVLSGNTEPYLTDAGIAENFNVGTFHLYQGTAIFEVL